MKKIMKMAFAVVAFAAVGLGSYKAYSSYTAVNMSEENLLFAENVLALSDGGTSGIECFCTQKGIGDNVCVANANGRNCGHGECWRYDANCRG